MEKCLDHIHLLRGLHNAILYVGHSPINGTESVLPHAETDRNILTLELPIRRAYEALERFHDWHTRMNTIESEVHESHVKTFARYGASYLDEYRKALDLLLGHPKVAFIEDRIGDSRFVAVVKELACNEYLDKYICIDMPCAVDVEEYL